MNTHPDFEELLRLLEEQAVDYMIVGGYAVAWHGYPRFTKDLDIFFLASSDNVFRLRRALTTFGFAEEDLPTDAFLTPGNLLTFGVAPSRVDLINQIDGVDFNEAQPNVVRGQYGKTTANFIGFNDLIKNKLATPRSKDKADIEELL